MWLFAGKFRVPIGKQNFRDTQEEWCEGGMKVSVYKDSTQGLCRRKHYAEVLH